MAPPASSPILRPSSAAESLPAPSYSLPEILLVELEKGPSSGRRLAGQLGVRWSLVFGALRELVSSGRVRGEGRGRASRFCLVSEPVVAAAPPVVVLVLPGCQFHFSDPRPTSCAWCAELLRRVEGAR